ncbi:MAG: hypothetical protein GTO42_02450 [Candidatus Latescibacteria bacterium]|nr:hypothetical protein [Candidatus Latescibacterota bacterium]NIO00997.1 hypothetical protein [Candidatus Latescibacterota bacterium]NIO27396.1 hypothetical protein [Candidatus Latescibacterota bacterium]NIO54918.1 hypothetical protein [Candidatus Latescibacterota bacterium]NIT01007.1 hypothetical protein [Candidatus Latescibacterota bacterium]
MTLKTALALLTILLNLPMQALSIGSFETTGYYKNFSVAIDPAKFPDTEHDLTGFMNNRLRLNVSFAPEEWFSFHVAYDFSPRIQDRAFSESAFQFPSIDPLSYRAFDFDSKLYPSNGEEMKSFAIHHNLDRALITLVTKNADIFLGRQAIAWGSARAVNPTDVVAPYTFDELDVEDRIGVDAFRIRIPIGALGELDNGYIFGDEFDFDESAFFSRCKLYIARSDVTALLLGFRESFLVGVDVARSLGGAGVWIEAAHVFTGALNSNERDSGEDYFRATVGCDYSFTGKAYGFIEYHINSAGATDPEEYLGRFSKPAYADGAVYLMGRHYLVPGLMLQPTPLFTLDAQALWNLLDPSILIAPMLEYNIAENIYISGGAFIGFGKMPHRDAGEMQDSSTAFRSEFGSYPDVYFASLRIYF